MVRIAVLGSTGSIGTQTIDVVLDDPNLEITYLASGSNHQLVAQQANQLGLSPDRVFSNTREQPEQLKEIVQKNDVDIVLNAVVGFAGLQATAAALEAGKVVALANKESLVAGGEILNKIEDQHGGKLVPVDSEHSAIFQCLWANSQYGPTKQLSDKRAPVNNTFVNSAPVNSAVDEIIITASGGPFRNYTFDQLQKVTLEDALKHPTWNMGQKITVDSSTLMNKGLEVIEAKMLFAKFGVDYSNIKVSVHPQSLVHGMVTFTDGSTIAQLSNPTMKLPIALALNYIKADDQVVRSKVSYGKIDWSKNFNMTFEPPNTDLFRCLDIAFEAGKKGGISPCVINAANEVAVDSFINNQISWLNIAYVVENTFEKLQGDVVSIDDLIDVDDEARKLASSIIDTLK